MLCFNQTILKCKREENEKLQLEEQEEEKGIKPNFIVSQNLEK